MGYIREACDALKPNSIFFISLSSWSNFGMAEEHNQHHHFFHHKEEEGKDGDYVNSSPAPQYQDFEKDEKASKHKEHASELGALAAGAFALVIFLSCTFLFKVGHLW